MNFLKKGRAIARLRYLNGKKHKLKAILFDSPGIIKSTQKIDSNIIDKQFQFDFYDIGDNITSYLSNPNFSNSCNKHIGNTYRVFINNDKCEKEKEFETKLTKLDKYLDKIIKKLKYYFEKINKSLNNIDTIKNSKFFLYGLYSMFNHKMIKKFIKEFDSSTGKPKYCERVKNWPMLQLDLSDKYNENLKNLMGQGIDKAIDLIPLPNLVKKPASFALGLVATNIADFAFEKILPGMHLVINIIIELVV